jgi:L-amino acid N-acyltransferase YncA
MRGTNSEMNIHHANESDIPEILSILQANLITAHHDKSPEDLEFSGFLIHQFNEDDIKTAIANPDHHMILVIKNDAEVVGYALSHDLRHVNPSWLDKIITTPDIHKVLTEEKVFYHRHIAKKPGTQSIGKVLLSTILTEAKNRGYRYIVCQIAQEPVQNKISQRLHESVGFLKVGFIQDEQVVYGIFLHTLRAINN